MASKMGSLTTVIGKYLVEKQPRMRAWASAALIELGPPSPKDIPEIRSGIAKLIRSMKSGSYRNLTVREAWLNTLVGIEIWCWFFVGECIGKRHLRGYKV